MEQKSKSRYLYALGTLGKTMLKRFWVFDIDKSGSVKGRFEALLGPGARPRFKYFEEPFSDAIGTLGRSFEQSSR